METKEFHCIDGATNWYGIFVHCEYENGQRRFWLGDTSEYTNGGRVYFNDEPPTQTQIDNYRQNLINAIW